MGKKQPKAPNAMNLAQQQQGYNAQAAQQQLDLNSIDRSNPFGSSVFQRDENGVPTGMTNTLSGALQGGANTLMGAYGSMAGMLPTSAFNSTTAAPSTDYLSQAYYDKGSALLQPQFAQARAAQDEQLTNRGLPIGSEARSLAEGNLARQQSLALSDLAGQAVQLAPAEQQRLITNARTDYQMPAQMLGTYGQNLGILGGLMPQVQQASATVGSPDYMGAANQQYQAQMGQYNAQMQGLGQMAGAGLGLLGRFI